VNSMTRKLTQRELRWRSGKILRALDGGEEFVVTRKGKPIGELRPIRRRKGPFIPKEEFIALFAGAPDIDYEQLREDIDRYVDQDPTPRYWVD
jgi:antitoxin (DNA-binding transcriptional repressor) of toxin-antitoxin stability system